MVEAKVVGEDWESEIEPTGGDVFAEVVNLSQSVVNTVRADLVRISQGGAETVIATEVELKNGGANRIQAQNVTLSQGGAAIIQAANLDLKEGGAGIIRAENVSMTESGSAIVYSQAVEMKVNSRVGLIVARQVNAENVDTKILFAGHVNGPVQTMMDTRQVLLTGLSAGVGIGLLLVIGQLFSSRK